MSEYTPTTEDVAFYYEGPDMDAAERRAEFDRWLAGERAKAWDEGFCVGERSGAREDPLNPYTENPYRERGERDD